MKLQDLFFNKTLPYTKYIEQTKLKEGEFVVWIGAILPEYEREAMDVLLDNLLSILLKPNICSGLVITPIIYEGCCH